MVAIRYLLSDRCLACLLPFVTPKAKLKVTADRLQIRAFLPIGGFGVGCHSSEMHKQFCHTNRVSGWRVSFSQIKTAIVNKDKTFPPLHIGDVIDLQGGPSHRRIQFADIKLKVPPQSKLFILKRNSYLIVNKRLSSIRCTTLYLKAMFPTYHNICKLTCSHIHMGNV